MSRHQELEAKSQKLQEATDTEKQWVELSPEEKQEALFQKWLSPKDPEGNDLPFQSPEAAKSYRERIERMKDAIQLKKVPDL